MSVRCFESTHGEGVPRSQMQSLTLWEVGGLLPRKIYFFDFIHVIQPGVLCVSMAALSTNWPVQYQLVIANVFMECL